MVERENNSVKYSIVFPKGEIHYILIQGIEPFKSMKLLGLTGNRILFFTDTTADWYYDEKTKSLYIKIRNKTEVEEIILNY